MILLLCSCCRIKIMIQFSNVADRERRRAENEEMY